MIAHRVWDVEEIWLRICQHLSVADLCNLAAVCTQFRRLASESKMQQENNLLK